MTPNLEALLLDIKANPEDDLRRLAYADALEEETRRGIRANLIRFQILGPDQAPYRPDLEGKSDPVIDMLDGGFCFTGEVWKYLIKHPHQHGRPFGWFDRGFLAGVCCSWEWWEPNGDKLREVEWVPIVHLTTGWPSAFMSYQLSGDAITVEVAGKNVIVELKGNLEIVGGWEQLMKQRWPGTEFVQPPTARASG